MSFSSHLHHTCLCCTLTFDPGQRWGENLGVWGLAPSGSPGGSAPGGGKKGSHFSTKKSPKNQLFHLLACCTLTSGLHCTFKFAAKLTCTVAPTSLLSNQHKKQKICEKMSSPKDFCVTIAALHDVGCSIPEIVNLLIDLKLSYKLIYNTVRRYQETGSREDWPRSGQSRTVRTPDAIKRTREKIHCMRKMAREEGMDPKSMRSLVSKDLGFNSFKKVHVQLILEQSKVKREDRAKLLLNKLKSGTQGPIFFTDEKLFTVEAIHNRQNDQILGRKSKEIPLKAKAIY